MNQKDNWLTPRRILTAVLDCFNGEIGLDPCAELPPTGALFNVPASRHFTPVSQPDGLHRSWWRFRTIFCNPPYSREGRPGDWCEKARAEYEEALAYNGPWSFPCRYSRCQIIMLLPARTDTAWIRPLAPFPRVFLHGRLKFLQPGGVVGPHDSGRFPSVIIALGVPMPILWRHFHMLGDVYESYRPSHWHQIAERKELV